MNKYSLIFIIFIIILSPIASAKTWYVDDDGGPGIAYIEIQQAVKAATDGDTIFVFNGTYYEFITVHNKSLRLIGEEKDKTIITSSGIGDGIIILNSDNCVISGFTVRNSDYGIRVLFSTNNTIYNNNITLNTKYGMSFHNSSNNSIINNVIHLNAEKGISLNHNSNYNTVSNNIVTYIMGGVEGDEDCIEITNSSNNRISDNEISYCDDDGIEMDGSYHNIITNNKIYYSNGVGIDVRGSLYNLISNNRIYLNEKGIELGRSWDVDPILGGSSYNTITHNIVYQNEDGIKLEKSNNNIIDNNVLYANENGISLISSKDNQIYNNNFLDNEDQAKDDGSTNLWDKGPVIGGNYWSDYYIMGNVSDGTKPYYIDHNSIDHYPFGNSIGILPPLQRLIIEFISPSDEETVKGIITINTNTSDNIDKMEFYLEGKNINKSLLNVSLLSPHRCIWDTKKFNNGHYKLSVKGYDANGSYITYKSIEIFTNNPLATPIQIIASVLMGIFLGPIISRHTRFFEILFKGIKNYLEEVIKERFNKKSKWIQSLKWLNRDLVVIAISVLCLTVAYSIVELAGLSNLKLSEILKVSMPFSLAITIIAVVDAFVNVISSRIQVVKSDIRLWGEGIVALFISSIIVLVPFGVPNRIDILEKDIPERVIGLRILLRSTAMISLLSLFYLLLINGYFETGKIGITVILMAFMYNAFPLKPLDGEKIFRWNKPICFLIFICSIALFSIWELGLRSYSTYRVIGFISFAIFICLSIIQFKETNNNQH